MVYSRNFRITILDVFLEVWSILQHLHTFSFWREEIKYPQGAKRVRTRLGCEVGGLLHLVRELLLWKVDDNSAITIEVIIGPLLPSVSEAKAIAKLMEATTN